MRAEAGFDWRQDTPWRRLPLTLPGATLVGLAGLWAVGGYLPGSMPVPPEVPVLQAQFITLPPAGPLPAKAQKRESAPRPAQTVTDNRADPAPEPNKPLASLAAPPPPSAEDWQLAATYTLKNSKRYRNAWGQQVRSMMGTAVEGPDQGQVRFRITLNPDGSLALLEELWSTSAKASALARKAIQAMPSLPPTPTGKPLVFEKTISFLPYETGWPPSYKYDCLPDPPAFKNPFIWDGVSAQNTNPAAQQREERAADCHPSEVEATFEEENSEHQREIERNRWGR